MDLWNYVCQGRHPQILDVDRLSTRSEDKGPWLDLFVEVPSPISSYSPRGVGLWGKRE